MRKVAQRAFVALIGVLMAGVLIYGRRVLTTGPMAPVGVYLIGMIVMIGCILIMMCRDPHHWR